MLSLISSTFTVRKLSCAIAGASLVSFSAPAGAQAIQFTPIEPAPGYGIVCTIGGFVTLHNNDDTCEAGSASATELTFSGGAELTITGNGSSLSVLGGASSTLNGNTSMSGTQAFSGSTTFNSTVSFVGPAVTFDSGSTFNSASNFTAGVSTVSINNSGGILTGTLNASTGLSAAAGANINLGNNVIHGVAAGVAATDAVNVAQLTAATSGVTANVSALQATTATHTTEIAALQATTTSQGGQITALQTTTTTQGGQITALQTASTTQASQITAIQSLNTTQSNQITSLQAAQDLVSDRVDSLFDLRSIDRRDMKQGIAAAMSMAPAPMPSEPGKAAYAVNGAAFRGEYAIGGSMTYRLPTRAPTALNVGFSYAGNKNNGVRVGIAGEF